MRKERDQFFEYDFKNYEDMWGELIVDTYLASRFSSGLGSGSYRGNEIMYEELYKQAFDHEIEEIE